MKHSRYSSGYSRAATTSGSDGYDARQACASGQWKTKLSWRTFAIGAVTTFMVGEPVLGLAIGTYLVPLGIYLVIVIVGYISVVLSFLIKRKVYSDAGGQVKQEQCGYDDPFDSFLLGAYDAFNRGDNLLDFPDDDNDDQAMWDRVRDW